MKWDLVLFTISETLEAVKGWTSKRSWLVYNTFLTTINDTLQCGDDISLSYQSADSSQSKAAPPPPGGGPMCFKL